MEQTLFSDEAQRVVDQAHDEAERLGHDYVGTEHLLLALVRNSLLVNEVLVGLKIIPSMIIDEIGKIIQPSDEPATTEKLSYTQRAEAALDYARQQAKRADGRLDSSHLLLGLLSAQEGVASQVMGNLGLRVENVRHRLGIPA